LGNQEIKEIQRDIAQIIIPSWISKPPPNFGSPSHGKLKADTWQTICTICFPITLIKVWGAPQSGALENHQQLLDNFMNLVQAVVLATSHAISREQAEECLTLMQHYQEGILELFPGKHHEKPNLHAALNLPELLLKCSPVHAWWAYAFEQLIGNLQQTNTNQKIGEYGATPHFLLDPIVTLQKCLRGA